MAIINKIELPDGEVYDLKDEGAKRIQTAINSPDASGNATAFIDTISQDTNGVITATKKTIPAASTSTAGLLSAADKTKLDSVESGAQPNAVISVNSKTGAVVLNATDVGAIKSDLSYNIASYPYTGSEVLLLHNPTTGNNTITDVATFLSSATGGGGGGSSQGALVHYIKTISLAVSSTSQTFNDENITASMVVIEYTFSNPAAQGSDLTITTADGSVTIAGTITETTNLTLYFGVSVSVPPTIQVNLGSNSSANILNASVNPGVFGTLGRGNGGTGVIATDLADLRDKLGITPANLGAVAKAGDTMTGNLGIKSTWPSIQLYANGGTQLTGELTSHKDNGRIYITEHSIDGTKEEYYQLPIADSTGTFQILTTKTPVTSSQGGTGGPYFYTCSGKTSLVVTSSNGWGGFAVLSITASSAHLTAIGFNGTNTPNAVNIYGGDPGLNPQLSSSNTITCTLRSDRHYIIIGTDKVMSISAS